jgi:signal transduction histidine kinase
MQLFDARSVVVSIQSPTADRYCWQVLRSEGTPPEIRSIDASHDPGNYAAIAGPEPHTTLHYRDDRRRGVACTGNVPMLTRPRLTATAKFWVSLGCESVLEHSVELDDGWRVRVFLVDPKSYQSSAAAVHLLHALYGQIAPALLKMFLSRRLRSQVLTRERARFARELHDRVVQALIALEIQVTVLTRRAAARPVLAQLEELQRNLRAQVDDVREMMRDVRPLRLKGTEVPAYIEALVERFEKRSDIHAHFECDVDRIDLMPHACGELVRLIEEALVNVQKHSGASEVLVSLKRGTNSLELTVIDNGRGFEFDGGMAPYALPPHERPRVIEERANAIGALLSIQSRPGSGARLDVTLPYAS